MGLGGVLPSQETPWRNPQRLERRPEQDIPPLPARRSSLWNVASLTMCRASADTRPIGYSSYLFVNVPGC
jgi:hypothetical protein